jgi:hypothetical protein
MSRRELYCQLFRLSDLRFPELVLFKNRTGAVQPLSLTPYTAKDVPRIVIVGLDRRSKRDFVSVCENLFRYLLAVYLFEKSGDQPTYSYRSERYSPMFHCCCLDLQCRRQAQHRRLSSLRVSGRHGRFYNVGLISVSG